MLSSFLTLFLLPLQMINYALKRVQYKFFKDSARANSTLLSKKPYFLIASLGNPEPKFARTRHNVGNWVLTQLVESYLPFFSEFKLSYASRGEYSTSATDQWENVKLFKSTKSFMNLLGNVVVREWESVQALCLSTHSPHMIVLHDEVQLPLGRVQLRRPGTSARGHNGLRSIDAIIGQSYFKVSIGIGKSSSKSLADHVLSPFVDYELDVLNNEVIPQIVLILGELVEGK